MTIHDAVMPDLIGHPKTQNMTDKELIRGIKDGEGSQACFRELYESYCLPLYKYVLSYVKSSDTAKEITHEALVKLWMHRETLDENRSVRAYLFTTCKNSLIKELRRQVKNPHIEDWLSLSGDLSVESRISYDYDTYLNALSVAIGELSPRQQEIFRLSREEGLAAKEISDRLGIQMDNLDRYRCWSAPACRLVFHPLSIKNQQ